MPRRTSILGYTDRKEGSKCSLVYDLPFHSQSRRSSVVNISMLKHRHPSLCLVQSYLLYGPHCNLLHCRDFDSSPGKTVESQHRGNSEGQQDASYRQFRSATWQSASLRRADSGWDLPSLSRKIVTFTKTTMQLIVALWFLWFECFWLEPTDCYK